MELFGPTEFAVRLPSALAGVACVLTVYSLAHRLFGRTTAALSALILLSIPHFFHYARLGNTDALLMLFITLALYQFWLAQVAPKRLRHYLWLGLFFGLAVMTKSAVALLIPGVAGCFLLATGQLRRFFEPRWLLTLAMLLLVAAPWHIQQSLEHGDQFTEDYLHHQFLSRLSGSVDAPVRTSPFYYLDHLLNRAQPYSFLAIGLFPILIYMTVKRRSIEERFVITWAVSILVAFSVAPTKHNWYILPLYPAFAILVARAALLATRGRGLPAMQIGAVLILLGHFAFTSDILIPDYAPDQKALGLFLRQQTEPGTVVSLYTVRAPTVIFYSQRRCIQYSSNPDIQNPGTKNNAHLSPSFFTAPAADRAVVAARLDGWKHAAADRKRLKEDPDAALALPRHKAIKDALLDEKHYSRLDAEFAAPGGWTKKYGPVQLFRTRTE